MVLIEYKSCRKIRDTKNLVNLKNKFKKFLTKIETCDKLIELITAKTKNIDN